VKRLAREAKVLAARLPARDFFIAKLLVRIHFIIEMFWAPASRHGSLNSLFQVACSIISWLLPGEESTAQLEHTSNSKAFVNKIHEGFVLPKIRGMLEPFYCPKHP
jgi:hypothetical protein